ncbi:MAG: HAD-IA family hydrolase [Planctomycetes bacterium]|nr:HAD-IA family hydrolase [Planctomycetota bacterium]
MSPRRIDLVVFDLGRVMIRLCDGWKHACERAGVPYRPGLDTHERRDQLLHLMFLNETGKLDHADWSRATAELVGMQPGHVSAILDAWLDGPFPGWDGLLDRIEQAGIRTACLSNTNGVHWEMMTRGDGPHRLPLHRLNYQFASHIIGAHKPDPAIYRHVEEATGVTPSAILFFDDVAANVEGARRRGWEGQTIEHPGDPVAQITESLRQYGVLK